MLPEWFKEFITKRTPEDVPKFMALMHSHSEQPGLLDETFENGMTPLVHAARCGNISMVKCLLSFHVDISKVCEKKILNPWNPNIVVTSLPLSPLQAALESGSEDCVGYLLKHGANPLDAENGFLGLLTTLLRWDSMDLIDFIVQKHFDVEFGFFREAHIQDFKRFFLEAVRVGNVKLVHLLLKAGLSPNFLLDGVMPLVLAAHAKHPRMCLMLIHNGAYLGGARGQLQQLNAQNPLLAAALGGWKEALRVLVALGGDVNEMLTRQTFSDISQSALYAETPLLHHVVAKDNADMTAFLVEELKADPNSLSAIGNTVLHTAVQAGAVKCFDYFLSEKCSKFILLWSLVNTTNRASMTPLMLACELNEFPLVQKLLRVNSVIDPVQPFSKSALNLAIEKNNDQIVEKLLLAGANVKLSKPCPPIITSAKAGNATICEMLLEWGADPHVRSAGGESTLFLAAKAQSPDCMELFVKRGCDVNRTTRQGHTPLMILMSTNRLCLLTYLLEHGANMNITTRQVADGPDFALKIASFFFYEYTAQLLIAHGCELDILWFK